MDQIKARRFDDVSYEEAMRRAADMVPFLREHASEGDKERHMPASIEAELRRTGLPRFLQPKAWGGMELPFVAWVDIPEMLARGDCSTGWNIANLASHHRTLAVFSEQAQRDVWEDDPDTFIASGIVYQMGRARRVDGGVILSGTWPYCSAVIGSTWNILAAIVMDGDKPADWVQCLVPVADYEVIDDWHTLGMRGTGSCTVKVHDVFVPEHRVESMALGKPGHHFRGIGVNTNTMYQVPTSALGPSGLGGCVVGVAQGALDATVASVKGRSTTTGGAGMAGFPTVHLRIGMAAAKIDAARLILRNDCIEADEQVRTGKPLTNEHKLRIKRNICLAGRMAVEAVDMLHEMGGAGGIYDHSPMQRMFRDAKSASAHIHFSIDMQMTAWGNVTLGGEFKSPTL